MEICFMFSSFFFFLRILCYDGNLMHQVPNVSDVAPVGIFLYKGRSRATLPISDEFIWR